MEIQSLFSGRSDFFCGIISLRKKVFPSGVGSDVDSLLNDLLSLAVSEYTKAQAIFLPTVCALSWQVVKNVVLHLMISHGAVHLGALHFSYVYC